MGNRSFLYLTASPDDPEDARSFAEANNNLPTLWQILLAEGKEAAPITYQRVFGDAGTGNLCADARTAIRRVERLAACVSAHPLLHTRPAVAMQFDALLAYMRAEIVAVAPDNQQPVAFSANVDELSWLEESEDFIGKTRRQCNELWTRLEIAMDSSDYPAIDDALGVNDGPCNFSHRDGWAYQFGFAGLDHEYFNRSFEERNVPFATFEPEPADAWLGDGLEKFVKNGRCGVHKLLRNAATGKVERQVLVPAEWDTLRSSKHSDPSYFWVSRDARYGLLHADDAGTRLLIPCELDDVWDYEATSEADTARRVAAVLQNDVISLIDETGRWVVAPDQIDPRIDELWTFQHGLAVARHDQLMGAINGDGHWVLPPQYEQLEGFNAGGYSAATRDGTAVIVNAATGTAGTHAYDRAQWADWIPAFMVERKGKHGWLRPDGSLWIAPEWDEIQRLEGDLFAVRRDKLWGLLKADGTLQIEPQFRELEDRRQSIQGADAASLPPQFFAKRDKLWGLIDAQGATLIPFEYAELGNPFGVVDDGNNVVVPPALVKVVKRVGRRKAEGLWNLDEGRLVVPCRYDHVFPATLYREPGGAVTGYLGSSRPPESTRDNELPLRLGILRADGSELYGIDWAWIGDRYTIEDFMGASIVARRIAEDWSDNRATQAAAAEGNRYAWLKRDGTIVAHDVWLRERFAQGDFDAAYQLSCNLHDGEGIEADEALSSRWLALAAGMAEADLPQAPASGLRRLLKRNKPSWMPRNPDARGNPDAARELSRWLDDDNNPQHDSAAARAWLEHAIKHRGKNNAQVLFDLAYLYDASRGGAEDLNAAAKLYAKSAKLNYGPAAFHLGWCYEFGRGVKTDIATAMKHYRTASTQGDKEADYRIGRLLRQQAEDRKGKDRENLLKQAAYHWRKTLALEDSTVALAASAEIACLMLEGSGGQKRDPDAAERLLLDGAEKGDASCIDYLAHVVYGDKASPKYDSVKAKVWKKRLPR